MKRALHYVFKIGDRKASYDFYTGTLGMKILRHEEFDKGCEATCNGPYDGCWSKTMVGYGDEDDHFVIELTYNYGVGSYQLGNDFAGIFIRSSEVNQRIRLRRSDVQFDSDSVTVYDPDGHAFTVSNETPAPDLNPLFKVSLCSSTLATSVQFWNGVLGMDVVSVEKDECLLTFGKNQCRLELKQSTATSIDRATGFGRIAFSCPNEQLSELERRVENSDGKVLTPMVTLSTPEKADVQVVILADPDGHEICFVGDESFRQLSQTDPKADAAIQKAIMLDKSEEWFKRVGGKPGY